MVPYKIGRSSLDKERAVVHDHQPVAEPGSLVEIMRGEDNGISLRPEKLKAVPDQVSCLRVEADGRLVKDEQVRVVDERPGEDEPAFHAPGELVDGGVALLGERHKCEQLLHPPFCLCRRDIKVPGIGEKVSCTREVRVKVGFLRDDADPLLIPAGFISGSMSKTRRAPDVRGETHSIIRMVVVFPAPLGPRKPKISPFFTENRIWLTATISL